MQKEADSTTLILAAPVTGSKVNSPKRPEVSSAMRSMDKLAKWDRIFRKTSAASLPSKSQRMFKDRQNKYRLIPPKTSATDPPSSSTPTNLIGGEKAGDTRFVIDRRGALNAAEKDGRSLDRLLVTPATSNGEGTVRVIFCPGLR